MTILRTKTKRRIFKKLKKAHKELISGKIDADTFEQLRASYMGIIKHCKNRQIKREINKIL